MPLILSLETSTDVCSVALRDGERLLSERQLHQPQVHAAQLAPLIDQVVKEAGCAMDALKAVAVASGPGSYTGLRIGTSTAKGICYALDIPLIAIGTLELLAFQAKSKVAGEGKFCPMIDARRMEVYCLVADADLNVLEPVSARVIDAQSFEELLGGSRVFFFGNGAEKCEPVIRHPHAVFLKNIVPLASSLGVLAEDKFLEGAFEDLTHFTPFYLKEFLAKAPSRKN